MADITANAEQAESHARRDRSAGVRSDALTGPVLVVMCVAAGLLLVAETVLGVLWAFGVRPDSFGLIFVQ